MWRKEKHCKSATLSLDWSNNPHCNAMHCELFFRFQFRLLLRVQDMIPSEWSFSAQMCALWFFSKLFLCFFCDSFNLQIVSSRRENLPPVKGIFLLRTDFVTLCLTVGGSTALKCFLNPLIGSLNYWITQVLPQLWRMLTNFSEIGRDFPEFFSIFQGFPGSTTGFFRFCISS